MRSKQEMLEAVLPEAPWLRHLRKQDIRDFQRELFCTALVAARTRNWKPVVRLVESWKATAEAYADPELSRILRTRGNPDDYVPLHRK